MIQPGAALCRAAGLLLAAGGALAQGAQGGQQVVVTGQTVGAAEQRRESTVAMTVIDRDELDQHGDTGLLDLLQRQPGITIDGETPKLRGLGAGYTLILLNGEPAPPGFSLDSLAPADIDRIEIVKGPTAEHGGVAGTINVILRVAPRLRQREWRTAIGYRALAPQASSSLGWGDRIDAVGFHIPLTAYTWANAADLSVQRVSRLPTGEVREQQVLGADQWRGGGLNFGPRLDVKLSATDSLQWQTFLQRNESDNRYQRETRLLAGPPLTTVSEANGSHGLWQMSRTQLQWQRRGTDGSRLEIKGAAHGSRSRSAGTYEGRDASGLRTALRDSLGSTRESGGSHGGRLREPMGTAHTVVVGWDIDHRLRRELRRSLDNGVEVFSGTIGVPFTAASTRSVLFAQDEWEPAPRWSLMAGLRAERGRIETAGKGTAFVNRYDTLSPVMHLRHAFDAQGRDLLRASIARSTRVPDIGLLLPRYSVNGTYERDVTNTPIAADSAGNPLLQPERSTGFDLAYEKHLPGGGVLSAGMFHRRIEQLIRRRIALENVAEAPVPRWVSRPVNFGRAHSSGLELEIKGRAEDLLPALVPALVSPKSGLNLRASLSVYRSAVERIDDPDGRLDGQAPWGANLGFDHVVPGTVFSYGASLALAPAFATQQTDRQRVWRGAARRLDAFMLWRFSRELHLRIAGQNLLRRAVLSDSRVDDLDGFAAESNTRREGVNTVTAHLLVRF